ncbi:MAG: beta-ketoacyl-ACP synthase II [Rhodanobacteraceae bacterium]
MSKRRVVVTGIGLVSPVGNDVATAWKNVIEGVSAIGPITQFDASAFPTRIAGEIRNFDPTAYVAPKEVKKMDPFILYGIAGATEAMTDAGLEIRDANATRAGVAIGAGIGGISTIERTTMALRAGGPRKVSPFYVPATAINMVAGYVSIKYGMKGPNFSCATACATATHNIGLALRVIQYGDADVMVAGGCEHSISPDGIGGFCAAHATSTRNDEPTRASRPWDRDRDGFVLSDGAGIVVLEEYEHAKARGAHVYAELAGFGMSADAHHITAPSESGDGAALCMAHALADAGVNPSDVQYVNAHGTSTPLGDLAEVRAIKRVFGAHAARLAVSSTKSVTGHLAGAAGGVEAIFTLLAIRDNVLPPTINLDAPGEGCDLDFVANTARTSKVDVAISNSFGFGGTNGALVLKRM